MIWMEQPLCQVSDFSLYLVNLRHINQFQIKVTNTNRVIIL
jgi:hypothetical protein